MLKKETYIPSSSLHDREMGGKDVCISQFELAFFNIEAILYIDNPRARHFSLRDSSNTSARMFVASPNTQLKDKPDMIEANTTYLWQTPNSIVAKEFSASVPASPVRPQFGFASAWANTISASRINHSDMAVASVSAFFVSGNTSLPQHSA